VGNRATADGVNYVSNALNQYSSVGAQAIMYDTNGNLTDDGTNTYTYDEENRLLTADNINHSASYTYDPFNRRVSKTVDGVTTYYVYDGDEVIAEYDVGGLLTAEYTYADSIDEVLTMDRNGNTYYYHYDGLGSVTDVTDAAGAVQESYKYNPYGQPSIFDSLGSPIISSAIGNRYMFTGREWDSESEIYYYRARMYDPALGRFLQRDPLGYVDSLNLYSYTRNNPVNWLDPTGESASDVIFYTSYGKFSVNAQDAVYFLFTVLAALDGYDLLGDPFEDYYPCDKFLELGKTIGAGSGAISLFAIFSNILFSAGGNTVLYSGKDALELASLTKGGGKILADTLGGKILNALERIIVTNRGKGLPKVVWKIASAIFAGNASGVVKVYLSEAADYSGIFYTIEAKIIEFLGNAEMVFY